MLSRKKIIKYVIIIIVVKVIGFSLFFMYSVKPENEEIKGSKHQTLSVTPMQTINAPEKMVLSKEERLEQKNSLMKWKLEQQMEKVYNSSLEMYDKKKKKKANLKALKKHLDTFKDTDVFVANYYEKTLYGSNDYEDIDARTIVLEEIQKVRRRGGGYIISMIDRRGTTRYILVKNLKPFDLYIGINIIE